MSTATELLRRALEALHFDLSAKESAKVTEDIRAFLEAEPEADKPVAWGHPNTAITGRKQPLMTVNLEIPSNAQYPQLWVPLYLHPPRPEPARKPMSDEEIADAFYTSTTVGDSQLAAFAEGFRQAERKHEIGRGME